MIKTILLIISLFSCLVIIARAEPTLNRMKKSSALPLRAAFHLLTVGAVAEIALIILGSVPSWPMAMIALGAALLLCFDRRFT